jgi:AbiV family abortive infection protein
MSHDTTRLTVARSPPAFGKVAGPTSSLCQTVNMAIRRLPDLSPEQVIRLQDALLENADTLLSSALSILELGHASLARSLAILGLEESGKALAVHERRVELGSATNGEKFRCEWLDELWASHEKKLDVVHGFLVNEPYWFDTEEPDEDENASYLGTIKSWSRRHDRSKQRGFYVDLSKTGEVMAPPEVADEVALREVLARVHQLGWQLRLGEHIEGKLQDQQEAGVPAMSDEDLAWFDDSRGDSEDESQAIHLELKQALKEGVPGSVLANAAYRFNPAGAERAPFRNLGKPGYEAETRELMGLDQRDSG